MPEALAYDPADRDLRAAADKEYKTWSAMRETASAWYDGKIPDVLVARKRPSGPPIDNNVKLNLFKKRLDRRRDFLFKDFPQLEIDDSPDDSATEKWLRDAWAWNKAATLWGLAVLNGGFSGQPYLRIIPARPNRDKYPRAILLSNVITVWQADDVDTPLWYEVYYDVGKDCYRQDIVDLSLVQGDGEPRQEWAIYTYKRTGANGTWDFVKEDAWTYPLGPIISWQHWPRAGRCYGASEFDDIDLNTAVNRIMSLGNAVIRNHAFPKTIVSGANAAGLKEIAPDTLWEAPAGAEVFNLEMQSDLSAILSFVERLTADYNTQGRTVDVAGGPADFSAITNLAIKVSFMPQEDANEILKRQYGWAIVEASKRLLMLDGQNFDVEPQVVWETALPESKLETAQVMQIEDGLGLSSKESQSTSMGRDWLQEQQRILAEQQVKKMRRFGQQDAQQAQAAFNGLPSLDQLKAKQNGGNGTNGGGL